MTSNTPSTLGIHAPEPGGTCTTTPSRWRRHAGIAVFLFFLIKGLAWLLVPAALAALAAL